MKVVQYTQGVHKNRLAQAGNGKELSVLKFILTDIQLPEKKKKKHNKRNAQVVVVVLDKQELLNQ